MLNRKLTLILICILLVLISILFFYVSKDMFARRSGGIDYKPVENDIVHEPAIPNNNNGMGEEPGLNNTEIQNNNLLVENDDSGEEIIEQAADNIDTLSKDSSENKEAARNSEKQNEHETEQPTDNANETKEQKKGDTINILLLGIDRIAPRVESSISFSSDSIMLASIDITNNKANILSIPRDSYVHIPIINKKDKIAYSYAYGFLKGKEVKSTIETINALAGKPVIDYYFALDMEPIPQIVDGLGGVEINEENAPSGAGIPKEPQIINGENILSYIRWRNSDDGDIGRINRHHKILKAMFEKIFSYDKEKFVELFVINEQYIDTDMGIEQIVNLANIVSGFKNEDINFSILPGKPQTIDNISYWIIDEDEAKKLIGGI